MKENPELRHAMPMSGGPPRRFVVFDPKKHTEEMRDKIHRTFVEVNSHICTGESLIPNPEYNDTPFEESIIEHPVAFPISQ